MAEEIPKQTTPEQETTAPTGKKKKEKGKSFLETMREIDAKEQQQEEAREAAMQAQLAEANDVLEVDSIAERRRQGLILETIGEVKQMFSSIIPAQMAVSSKAMSYLSRYLASGKKIGRS